MKRRRLFIVIIAIVLIVIIAFLLLDNYVGNVFNIGEAQIAAGTSKPEWQKYRTAYRNAGHGEQYEKRIPLPPYGDDPRDQDMIKRGFRYYDANKNNLKEED